MDPIAKAYDNRQLSKRQVDLIFHVRITDHYYDIDMEHTPVFLIHFSSFNCFSIIGLQVLQHIAIVLSNTISVWFIIVSRCLYS